MAASRVTLSDLHGDAMLTLQEACDLFFRGRITPDTLWAEKRRGRLAIVRIGRADWVSPTAMRELMSCPDQPKVPESGSPPESKSGSSGTARILDAQVAAKAIAQELKKARSVHLQKIQTSRPRR